MPTSNIPLEQRLKVISPDGANVKFEIERFGWIGTPVQEPQITWVWHTAPVHNVDDLRTTWCVWAPRHRRPTTTFSRQS
jgi:hypothetical protein